MAEEHIRLKRELTLWPLVLLTLAYMAPLVAIAFFGTVADLSKGASASSYILVTVAMVFTALSYGQLARRHPMAGSAYTYVRRTVDSRVGFLVGWAVLLDYFWIPMVAWLLGATFMNAWIPALPIWACLLLFIVPVTIVNLLGIKVVARVNYIFFGYTVLVLILWIVFSIVYMVNEQGFGSLFAGHPFWNSATSFAAISAGAALAAISFLGFDACTMLTEETHDARKTVPRAVLLSCVIGGIIFALSVYFGQLVHPGGVFDDPSTGASEVAKQIGGAFLDSMILSGIVVGEYISVIVMQASASRLMYAMGRDGVLPKAVFGRLSRRFHTPWTCILFTVVVAIPAFITSLALLATFVNFGAFVAFTMVNVGVVALAIREKESRGKAWMFTMLLMPLVGIGVNIWLITSLDKWALVFGLGWLAIGIVYLIWLTRGFRKEPPELDFDEEQAIVAEKEDEIVELPASGPAVGADAPN
jgi:putrescine importer